MSRELADEASAATRPAVEAMDELLGRRFPVLDDGFVRVVDYMGGDAAIVQAARVSYGEGTKRVHEDRGLIRYLMRHDHTTPFEMCEVKLHVRVPMDAWRQWIRHRTANVNEYSTRYSRAIDAAQRTAPSQWRRQSTTGRQGSHGVLEETLGASLTVGEEALQRLARDTYRERIDAGVAREQARKDLPLSTYTEAYWKVDLHNLLHFLRLRMDEHAQLEIRSYARIIGEQIVARWCPLAWEAFVDYRLEGMRMSRLELAVVRRITAGDVEGARQAAREAGLLVEGPSRERRELAAKLRTLALPVPWEVS